MLSPTAILIAEISIFTIIGQLSMRLSERLPLRERRLSDAFANGLALSAPRQVALEGAKQLPLAILCGNWKGLRSLLGKLVLTSDVTSSYGKLR